MDASSRCVYHKIFEWLQIQLSTALANRSPEMRAAGIDGVDRLAQLAPLSIGLLDIFGFEIFERNSLEQVRYTTLEELALSTWHLTHALALHLTPPHLSLTTGSSASTSPTRSCRASSIRSWSSTRRCVT